MNRHVFLLFAAAASPALAQSSAQIVATADTTYRQGIERMQAQQLATQQQKLLAACRSARAAGTTLPPGC